jgi:predicted benzoate:H+ symporter BenE
VERLNGQFIVFRSVLALEAYSETKQATLDICDTIQKHSLYAICFSAFYGLVLGIGIHSIATYKKRKKDNKINSTD